MKSNAGINVFKNTGFHSYLDCLKTEANKAFNDRTYEEFQSNQLKPRDQNERP
jgi:hypothetical protein